MHLQHPFVRQAQSIFTATHTKSHGYLVKESRPMASTNEALSLVLQGY